MNDLKLKDKYFLYSFMLSILFILISLFSLIIVYYSYITTNDMVIYISLIALSAILIIYIINYAIYLIIAPVFFIFNREYLKMKDIFNLNLNIVKYRNIKKVFVKRFVAMGMKRCSLFIVKSNNDKIHIGNCSINVYNKLIYYLPINIFYETNRNNYKKEIIKYMNNEKQNN